MQTLPCHVMERGYLNGLISAAAKMALWLSLYTPSPVLSRPVPSRPVPAVLLRARQRGVFRSVNIGPYKEGYVVAEG